MGFSSITAKRHSRPHVNANMEFEKLALEVGAIKAGLNPVTPHVIQGATGIDHRFNLVFSDGTRAYAFDFCDRVTEIEVVKSYAKKLDTGASVNIVCTSGEITARARELAVSYDMRIITSRAVETFFAMERAAPKHTFR